MMQTLLHAIKRGLPVVFLILTALTTATAQPDDALLLAQPRHIAGTVVEDSGDPIAGASIDHSGDHTQIHKSSGDGRFSLDTRAPVLVVRKAGFRSVLIHTESAASVTITLHKASLVPLPACTDQAHTVGIDGWGARLRFTPIDSVKAGKQGRDVDYGYRTYRLKGGGRKKPVMMHGTGPMWGPGEPFDADVWNSVTYEETAYDAGGTRVIEARGEDANHHHWRSIGLLWGETVTYSDADEATAREFNRFLDGICALPIRQQSR
jgi:hypothetical protein